MSTPAGASSRAARASAVLYDSALRLPERARICIGLRGPRGREVRLEDDLVGEEEGAAPQLGLPLGSPGSAVDGTGELEADPLVAPRVVGRPGELTPELDGLGDALDGQIALDDDLATVGCDGRRGEAELGVPLRVEEVRRLDVRVAIG